MKKRNLLFICCGVILWLSGCVNVPPTHYYAFRPDSVNGAELISPKYPYVLGIEAYEANFPYQQDKIIFRTSPYEVNFYEYHRWLHPPTDLVTEQVQKLFFSSGLFERIHARPFESYSDYILQGSIHLFDQWDTGSTSISSIRIRIYHQLILPDESQILWAKTIETTATVPSLEIVEIVKGFETALQENIRQAIAAIDKVLEHHP